MSLNSIRSQRRICLQGLLASHLGHVGEFLTAFSSMITIKRRDTGLNALVFEPKLSSVLLPFQRRKRHARSSASSTADRDLAIVSTKKEYTLAKRYPEFADWSPSVGLPTSRRVGKWSHNAVDWKTATRGVWRMLTTVSDYRSCHLLTRAILRWKWLISEF